MTMPHRGRRRSLGQLLAAAWYRDAPWLRLLLPAVLLYRAAGLLRRWRDGRPWRAPVPVVVVGNINVGGSGKTPLTALLAQSLRSAGRRPGILVSGYGGRGAPYPLEVSPQTDPALAGDEALLLAACGCPVMADPQRVRAAQKLLKRHDCDLLLSDDGLQHYALGRDVEIAVLDGQRGLGNRRLLPAGPLREPTQRLARVDYIVHHNPNIPRLPPSRAEVLYMRLKPLCFVRLQDGEQLPPDEWPANQAVHAVAGIGNPARFFATLEELGVAHREHPFPDHHPFRAEELRFAPPLPLVMTEKDAVKCRPFARPDWWFLRVAAQLEQEGRDALLTRLAGLRRAAA